MSTVPIVKYTEEEYLELEEASSEKNEFYKGEIFVMAEGSISHNQVVRNLMTLVDRYLSNGKKCQISPSDLGIHAIANSLYTYPDLSIICGKIETVGKKKMQQQIHQ